MESTAASAEVSMLVSASSVLSNEVLQLRSALSDMAAGEEAKGSVVTFNGSDRPKKGSGGGGMTEANSSATSSQSSNKLVLDSERTC